MASSLSVSCLKQTLGLQCLLALQLSSLHVGEPDLPQGHCSLGHNLCSILSEGEEINYLTLNNPKHERATLNISGEMPGSHQQDFGTCTKPSISSTGYIQCKVKTEPFSSLKPRPCLLFTEKPGSSMDLAMASLSTWFFIPPLFMLAVPMLPHAAERL